MAKKTLYNLLFALGGRRISRDANAFSVPQSRGEVDSSCFEDAIDQILKSTFTSSASFSGGNCTDLEVKALAALAEDTTPETLIVAMGGDAATVKLLEGQGVGTFAVFASGWLTNFTSTGNKGELYGFETEFKPTTRINSGLLLMNDAGTAGTTATGNGTAVELGAVTAAQQAIFALSALDYPAHAGAVEFDAVIESDVDATFASPVQRGAFSHFDAAASAGEIPVPGAELVTVDGPVTDTFWRIRISTFAGTSVHLLGAGAIHAK